MKHTILQHGLPSPFVLPSFLSATLRWWALLECSTTAFSHSESLIKLQPPHTHTPSKYTAKGKGHLFVTKCLSHSFTWQQSSMSFPTVKCQIWKPSLWLMFRVRLCGTFNLGTVLQSNKSLSNMGHGEAFCTRGGFRNIHSSALPLMYIGIL